MLKVEEVLRPGIAYGESRSLKCFDIFLLRPLPLRFSVPFYYIPRLTASHHLRVSSFFISLSPQHFISLSPHRVLTVSPSAPASLHAHSWTAFCPLNPWKIPRFSQPLFGQLHPFFQGKSGLKTQLVPCFFDAETRFPGQKADGFARDFRGFAGEF